jgi:cation diffusion facilitator family transporter
MGFVNSVLADPKARVEALSVCSNTLLVLGKFIAGFVTGSVGIIAEAIHSSIDLVSALIAFTSVRISGRPADKEHRYGHGKAENIAGSIEALLIFAAAVMILEQAVKRMINGGEVQNAGIGVAVMTLASIVNLIVSQILLSNGKKLESVALEADGMHLRTDVYTSVGVLLGMAALWITGINIIDPIIAGCVGLFIIHAAYEIFIKAFKPLMDESLPEEEEQLITDTLDQAGITGLVGYRELRTRRSGSDRFADLYLIINHSLGIADAHGICDQVENKLGSCLPAMHVLIHAEPCTADDCKVCKGCSEMNATATN